MPNIATVLKDEIRRLARKEIKAELSLSRKQIAQHRRDIAALKREVAEAQRTVNFLQTQEKRRLESSPTATATEDDRQIRFSAKGLKSHRERIGLSAADYGTLVGVSGQTVYLWEQGKTRPRPAQLPAIAEVRTLGKREALQRLDML